ELEDALLVLRLERLEEAVDDDELGLADERPRERRETAAARAHLPGEGGERLVEADPLEEPAAVLVGLALLRPEVVADRERDVRDDRAVLEQGSALEDGRRAGAEALVLGERHGVDVPLLVEDAPLHRREETGGAPDERRL